MYLEIVQTKHIDLPLYSWIPELMNFSLKEYLMQMYYMHKAVFEVKQYSMLTIEPQEPHPILLHKPLSQWVTVCR